MIVQENKISLDELAHYGVLGMKWGVRRSADAREINEARVRIRKEAVDYKHDHKVYSKAKGEKKERLGQNLRERRQKYLNNSDRAIAARMTRGEKVVSLFLGSHSGIGIAGAAAGIAASSAVSRRIEYKQETGGYKVNKSDRVRRHIGYDTASRLAIQAGSSAVPGVIKMAGGTLTTKLGIKIGLKAAANREAAKKSAGIGIASTAAKLKYAKAGRGGAYKITTMK